MSTGTLISILEKTQLNFSFLAGTASQTVRLRLNIDTVLYRDAQMFVRVHARDMTSGQSVRFALRNSIPSREDAREFMEPANVLAADVTSTIPDVPGIVSDSASGPGPFLTLVVTATQTSVSTTFLVEVSVELLLRC